MFLFVNPTNIALAAIHHAKTDVQGHHRRPGASRRKCEQALYEKHWPICRDLIPWIYRFFFWGGETQLLVSHVFMHGWLQRVILLSRFKNLSKKSRNPISPHHFSKDNIGWILFYHFGSHFWIFNRRNRDATMRNLQPWSCLNCFASGR